MRSKSINKDWRRKGLDLVMSRTCDSSGSCLIHKKEEKKKNQLQGRMPMWVLIKRSLRNETREHVTNQLRQIRDGGHMEEKRNITEKTDGRDRKGVYTDPSYRPQHLEKKRKKK